MNYHVDTHMEVYDRVKKRKKKSSETKKRQISFTYAQVWEMNESLVFYIVSKLNPSFDHFSSTARNNCYQHDDDEDDGLPNTPDTHHLFVLQ